MLHILFMVLKWIGIVLISLIGVVLFLILLVLFVPVRYRIKCKYNSTADAGVTVSWLLHIIHARVVYRDELRWQLRIFGIPVMDSGRPQKEKNAVPKKNRKSKKAKSEATEPYADEEVRTEKKEDEMIREVQGGEPEETKTFEKQVSDPLDPTEQTDEYDKPEKKENFFSKIRSFFRALLGTLSNIRYTIRKLCDKIKNIRDKISYYHSVITSKEGQQTIALIKSEVGKLFLHIAPKRFSLHFTFGFDDPATTGQLMAILSMLYPIYRYDIVLNPDFSQNIICGDIYMKGRIRVFTLLRIAWKVYFNKNLKTVLRMLQKEV